MTRQTFNKVLALLLTVLMLIPTAPAVAFADTDTDNTGGAVAQIGDTPYSDFATAWAAAKEKDSCTLKLLNNVTLSGCCDIYSGDVTLDLNGKKIENANQGERSFFISTNGLLTIIDTAGGGSIVAAGVTVYTTDGHVILGNADGTANNFTLKSTGNYALGCNDSCITVYGGSFVGTGLSVMVNNSVRNILADGKAFAKKDDTSSIVKCSGIVISESVTVVDHICTFVDGQCACGRTGSSEPETSEPETTEPETSEPETTEPETSEPETTEPSKPSGEVYVAEIGENKYTDFETAWAAAKEKDSCTLKLLNDVTLSERCNIYSVDVTFDLNGKKIENANQDGQVFNVSTNGLLTIIDTAGGGSIVASKVAVFASDGHVILGNADGTANNFTLKSTGNYALGYDDSCITVYGGSFVGKSMSIMVDDAVRNILADGKAFAKKDDTSSIVNSNGIVISEPVTVVDHTCTFVDGQCACGRKGSSAPGTSEPETTEPETSEPETTEPSKPSGEGYVAEIGDSKYTDFETAWYAATGKDSCTLKLLNDVTLSTDFDAYTGDVTLDLNGKKIENPVQNGIVFRVGGDGRLTVIDTVGGGKIVGANTTFYVNGGQLIFGKADGTASNFSIETTGNYALGGKATYVTAYGGSFVANGHIALFFGTGKACDILPEGKKFVKKDNPTVFVDGNSTTISESVTVVSHTHDFSDGDCACGEKGYVADVDGTKYMDIYSAFTAAAQIQNSTLTLLGNVSLTEQISVNSGKFNLDLNGKKLEYSRVTLYVNSELTVFDGVGGGSIVSTEDNAIEVGNGKLTLGTSDGTKNNFTVSGDWITLSASSNTVIYGGTYTAGRNSGILTNGKSVRTLLGENTALVEKGSVDKFVNVDVDKITQDVTAISHTHSFVNDACVCGLKYVAKVNNEKYLDIFEAYKAACEAQNSTLTLLSDATVETFYEISGNFTLDLHGNTLHGKIGTTFYLYKGDVTVVDTVGGGSITGVAYAVYVSGSSSSEAKLTLGKADGTANSFTVKGGTYSLYVGANSKVTIYGGTYLAENGNSVFSLLSNVIDLLGENLAFAKKDDTTVLVSGNVTSFSESVTVVSHTSHTYGDDGYCACGEKEKIYVAEVNGTKCEESDFRIALDKINSASVFNVKLLSDISISSYYAISSTTFNLDLNGHKVTILFGVSNTGALNIFDTVGGGSIESNSDTVYADAGMVTLGSADGSKNNFTVKGNPSIRGYSNCFKIYGGTYVSDGDSRIDLWKNASLTGLLGENLAFAKKDDTTQILNINNIPFSEDVTVVSHTSHMHGDDGYCACGDKITVNVAEINGVLYNDTNFETQLKALLNGGQSVKVKLLRNVTVSSNSEVKNMTFELDLNGKTYTSETTYAFTAQSGGKLTIYDTVGGGSIKADYAAIYFAGGQTVLGKADGTANKFTMSGGYMAIIGIAQYLTIYGGTYLAGSEASVKIFSTVAETLGDKFAFAKKNSTDTILDGSVSALTEDVTVVSHTHSLDSDGKCVCGYSQTTYKIGDNATATLDSKGNLVVSGTGKTYDYEYNTSPFYCNYGIKSINVEEGITGIGNNLFYYCSNVTKLTLPTTLESIGNSAFCSFRKLESLTIPAKVKTIGYNAFSGCVKIDTIVLPSGLETVGYSAFANTAIESITIPASVKELGNNICLECKNLKAITVETENANYASVDGVLFNKDKTILISYPLGKTDTEYTIPDTVTKIDRYAFLYDTTLTSITVPVSLARVESSAFGDTKLTDVYYDGSETKWNNIYFDYGNDQVKTTATKHFKHEHDFSGNIKMDLDGKDGTHSFKCSCEEYGNSVPHVWDNGNVTTPATHLKEGVKTFTCVCGATYTEPVEKLTEHEWDNGKVTTPATHLKEGVKTYTCPCGETKTEPVEKLTDHEWDNGKVTTPATHLKEGVKTYTCPCGETKTEPVEKLTDHEWDNGKVTTPATHLKEGVKTYTCPCGETKTEPVAKIAEHSYVDNVVAPSCTEKGYTEHTCACGDKYVDSYVDASGHHYENGTCTECGDVDPDYNNGDDNNNDNSDCDCICHNSNKFVQFIYKIVRWFWKLFNIRKTCDCGVVHY